ncbi:MAG TPA: spermidine/putrescine ABC transporter substrate-binding protein [Candidatus Limnocylindrales bacterium]|nr:spermidine/putrescine ABC transporter substrate-binding protein [Candidatus Limnocylindrales bacterium]
MADQDLDHMLKRMAQSKVNRRGFLWASGLSASAAALAACSPGATASPSSAAAPSAAASGAAPSDAASPSAVAEAVENELFMLNWGDYVDPDNMKQFQADFKVDKFTYDTFASNEELLTKLQGGAKGQYDISAPTAEFVPGMVEQGFLQKIDWTKVPNGKYIEEPFKNLWWDPKNEYQLPKDWGTTGISVRTKIVKEEVRTWKQFFEVAPKYSGRIVLVDSPGDVFVAPLKALGYSLNSVDEKELGEARDLLMKLAPHVLALDSDQYNTKIETEEAVLGLTWTGGIVELRDKPETADVAYYIPEDGTLFWMDTWVILADAPHPKAAHAFLNFIHGPEAQAKETMTNGYATCNSEAKKYIDPKVLADPAIFVPDDVLKKLEGAQDVSTNPLRIQIWEEFKSSIG